MQLTWRFIVEGGAFGVKCDVVGFGSVKCDVNCDVVSFWGVKCDVKCDVVGFWGVKCDVNCDVLQGIGRRSRPAVQPVTAVVGRHAARENIKQYYSPAGGGARFDGLPAKAGKGQILPSRTPVRLRLGQPTRAPSGWRLNAIRNRKHTRRRLSSAGQPGSTGSVQGCRKPY